MASNDDTLQTVHESTDPSDVAWITRHHKERIAGSPLLPDSIQWSEDGQIAVVTDYNIVIITFRNHQLGLYLENPPTVSKSFIYSSQSTSSNATPAATAENEMNSYPHGEISYLLMQTKRNQQYTKELSMSKNDSNCYISMEWGPRGSGPHASCAIIALNASHQITLHVMSSFHLSWRQVDVFSEHIQSFFEKYDNDILKILNFSKNSKDCTNGVKNQGTLSDTKSSVHKYKLLATTSIAWSAYYATETSGAENSLIAFSGKKITTIWQYRYPTFAHFKEGSVGGKSSPTKYLAKQPLGWMLTEEYGWITSSEWHQRQQIADSPMLIKELQIVLGTCEGYVLIVNVPLLDPEHITFLTARQIIQIPALQPVANVRLMSRYDKVDNLVVASGNRISVYNAQNTSLEPLTWNAHKSTITGLVVSLFGDTIVSSASDGDLKSWHLDTSACNVRYKEKRAVMSNTSYPLYGIAMSPLSLQIACLHVVPPAARPNRKSQADMSYTRVACAVEIFQTELVNSIPRLLKYIDRILDACASTSNFTDLVWLCDETQVYPVEEDSTELAFTNSLQNIDDANVAPASVAENLTPLYLRLIQALDASRTSVCQLSDSGSEDIVLSEKEILLLQAAYLIRSTVPKSRAMEASLKPQGEYLQLLYTNWANKCLKRLDADDKKSTPISESETLSALLMADFLSVDSSLSPNIRQRIIGIYGRFGTAEDIEKVEFNQQHHDRKDWKQPPSRQICFICQKPILFSRIEMVCENNHGHQRCFLSFKAINSVNSWKCGGCNACADTMNGYEGDGPFYFMDKLNTSRLHRNSIQCRLCGNICSYFEYGFCDVAA